VTLGYASTRVNQHRTMLFSCSDWHSVPSKCLTVLLDCKDFVPHGEFALQFFPEGKRFKKGGNTEKISWTIRITEKRGESGGKTSFALQG